MEKKEFTTMNSLGEMSIYLNDAQYERMKQRMDELKPVQCFEYNGNLFKGDYKKAALLFVYNNPDPADFFVWLQNNYEQIK